MSRALLLRERVLRMAEGGGDPMCGGCAEATETLLAWRVESSVAGAGWKGVCGSGSVCSIRGDEPRGDHQRRAKTSGRQVAALNVLALFSGR